MTRATTSAARWRTSMVTQDRWSRLIQSLTFSTAHLDNICALAWYASHLSSAGRSHRRGALDIVGPDATRARERETPMRRTSPTEGARR